jgi:hypothetical protein
VAGWRVLAVVISPRIGEQLDAIDRLDTGVRGGPEPDEITREPFGRPIPEA